MQPTIPVFDVREVTGQQLVDALIRSSCLFLTGHGFDDTLLDPVLRTSREFFALPDSEKALVQWSGELPWKGWQPVHKGGPKAMLVELFEVALTPGGQRDAMGEPVPLHVWADSFSQWPERPEQLRPAWAAAYAHLHGLASRIVTLIADGLDLPAEDLVSWTTNQHANLVVNHYLAQQTPPPDGRVRYRSHTDFGGITLLWADDSPGGLEARLGSTDQWVAVRHPPGALLVQAGDLLHLWSRGRIPANDHRVANPPRVDGVAQTTRYSMAYFHYPDMSTWVAPAAPADATTPPDAGGADGVAALDHVIARQQRSNDQDAGRAPG